MDVVFENDPVKFELYILIVQSWQLVILKSAMFAENTELLN